MGSNIPFVHRLHPLDSSVQLQVSHRIRSEEASFREFPSEIHMKAAISALSVIRHIFHFLLGSQMCCFLHQPVKKTNLSVSGRKVQRWKRKKKKISRSVSSFSSDLPEPSDIFSSSDWQPLWKLHQMIIPSRFKRKKKKKRQGYLVVLGYYKISLNISLQLRIPHRQVQVIKSCTGRLKMHW